jgi:hypothetical protein
MLLYVVLWCFMCFLCFMLFYDVVCWFMVLYDVLFCFMFFFLSEPHRTAHFFSHSGGSVRFGYLSWCCCMLFAPTLGQGDNVGSFSLHIGEQLRTIACHACTVSQRQRHMWLYRFIYINIGLYTPLYGSMLNTRKTIKTINDLKSYLNIGHYTPSPSMILC